MTDVPATDAPPIDERAVRRNFGRAAARFDAAATLLAGIRDELLDRCRWLLQGRAQRPMTVLDLGAGTGAALPALRASWPDATLLAVDFSAPMLAAARPRLDARPPGLMPQLRRLWSGPPLTAAVCAAAGALPLKDRSVDLVFANLMLHFCADPDAALREMQRVLRSDGLLVLSMLGPDTLRELRAAWSQVDDGEHLHRFVDMHDLGDALVRCGFREPVLDVDRLATEHRDVLGLMQQLRDLGAGNAATARRRGLTGRRRLDALFAAYPHDPDSNQVRASWEVVYASAFAGEAPSARGEFAVDAAQLGRSLAARRPGADKR